MEVEQLGVESTVLARRVLVLELADVIPAHCQVYSSSTSGSRARTMPMSYKHTARSVWSAASRPGRVITSSHSSGEFRIFSSASIRSCIGEVWCAVQCIGEVWYSGSGAVWCAPQCINK